VPTLRPRLGGGHTTVTRHLEPVRPQFDVDGLVRAALALIGFPVAAPATSSCGL